jgi:ABC-type Fe3+ transport system substrate-binding protein
MKSLGVATQAPNPTSATVILNDRELGRKNMSGLHTRRKRIVGAALCLLLGLSKASAADQALIDAAKKEGQVTWYTTFIVNQVSRPVAEAFQKKYGIKVNYVRANADDIVLRAENEAKAGKLQADVFDGTSGILPLKQAGLIEKWLPPQAKDLPPAYVDPQGYWVAASLYIEAFGYNTDLVANGAQPKSLADLLDPKWKGKLAMSDSRSSPGIGGFIGLVMKTMGQKDGLDYLRRLNSQNVAIIPASARQILDQVISTEYSVGIQILNHHVAYSAAQGAPVAWQPMNPSLESLLVLGLLKGPHPNAGKLLIEFLTSKEGQTLLRNADYIPVAPDVKPKVPGLRPDVGKFKTILIPPEQMDESTPDWMKIYLRIFR